MSRSIVWTAACAAVLLASCIETKSVRRRVIVDGKQVTEERPWRDPSHPFAYDGWAVQLKAHLDTKAASTGVGVGSQKVALREVSDRIMMLVNMRSQLAKDWNAFAVSEDGYQRRSEFIDRSFLALQTITKSNTNPDVNQAVLDQLAEWSRQVDDGPSK